MTSASIKGNADHGAWSLEDGILYDGEGNAVAKMIGGEADHRLACERLLVMANALNGLPTDAIANAPRVEGQHILASLILKHQLLTERLTQLTEAIQYHKREIAQLRQTEYMYQAEQASRTVLDNEPGAKAYEALLGGLRRRHSKLESDRSHQDDKK